MTAEPAGVPGDSAPTGPAGRGGVGIVVVSHSRPLADAAVALATQMVATSPPALAVAAGTADGGLGTDATEVAAAVTEVAATAPGGVLVLMDLGSAVLSAELAVELAGDLGVDVRLCPAPLVEGLVAATVQAATGASLAAVAAEAEAGAAGKVDQLGPPGGAAAPVTGALAPVGDAAAPAGTGTEQVAEIELINPNGLHVRPAAAFVAEAARFQARLTVADLTTGGPAVSARSLTAVGGLGADRGHRLRLTAAGPDADAALAALVGLVADGFGETDEQGEEVGGAAAGTSASAGLAPGALGVAAVPVPRTAPTVGAVPGPGGSGEPGEPIGSPRPGEEVVGLPAGPGVGTGPVWHLGDPLAEAVVAGPDGEGPDGEGPDGEPGLEPAAERDRLRAALDDVGDDVRAAAARATVVGADPAIFEAHALLLTDEGLLDAADSDIAAGRSAEEAWRAAAAAAAARFDDLPGEYQRARAADIRSVAGQVLRRLRGEDREPLSRPGVLVAADLGPDEVSQLDPDVVRAVVLSGGSPTSHAAILARSAGLPMVVAAGPGVLALPAGATVAVDGDAGRLVVEPAGEVLDAFAARATSDRAAAERARSRALSPALTLDGVRMEVAANVRSAADTGEAVAAGAEGVGLLRTEFLFLDRAAAPDEDEQVAAYLAVARAAGGHRVVVRTLDVGGDKPLPYVPQPVEANPFLGLRGLRLALARPELLDVQLRAIVRVAAEHPVGVMFPMVTTLDELLAAREALDRAVAALGLGELPDGTEIGIMVEVPAAALRAGHLAPYVDFFSVGTNDLVQYTLAAERGNAAVAGLGDGLDPAVLRLLAEVGRAAADHGTRLAVCGELAADPVATAALVGLGVRELSVAGRSVPAVKEAVRACSVRQAEELAGSLLELPTAAETRRALVAAAGGVGPPG